MLPSPSTRHSTNEPASYITVSRLGIRYSGGCKMRRTFRALLFLLSSSDRFSASFSVPTPCALDNKIHSVISFRGREDSSVPLAQTSTCRSSSSFLPSKYLFHSTIVPKRCVQRRRVNLPPTQNLTGLLLEQMIPGEKWGVNSWADAFGTDCHNRKRFRRFWWLPRVFWEILHYPSTSKPTRDFPDGSCE